MKKIIFIGFLVLIVTGAFGQIDISVGGQAGAGINTLSQKLEFDPDNYITLVQNDTLLDFGVFVDAVYARLAISYAMSLGGTQTSKLFENGEEVDSISADSPDGYSWTFLNIELLGKYPIPLGSVNIWPTAGILYSMTISQDFNGDGVADDLSDLAINDLYVSAGCGLDVSVTNNIFVTGSALFSWNLTPNPSTEEMPPEITITWYRIMAYLGMGYKF